MHRSKSGVLLALLLSFCFTLTFTEEAEAQRKKEKDKKEDVSQKEEKDSDEKEESKEGLKPYHEVITEGAKSREGLFDVHLVDGSYFYEIPEEMLGREMLMVTTIAKTASGIGYGGERTNTQMLRWDKKDKNLLLRVVSYSNTASDSLPIYEAVRNSNLEPILYRFDIKSKGKDEKGWVIEVTDLFSKDIQALGLQKSRRTQYKVSRLDTDRSYVDSIRTYPTNIEARYVLTYAAAQPPSNSSTGLITVEMNSSMVLLPEEPMMQRLADRRVGWFSTRVTDYGLDAQKATKRTYLDRWRLEVKEEDLEKFQAGELVEPKNKSYTTLIPLHRRNGYPI